MSKTSDRSIEGKLTLSRSFIGIPLKHDAANDGKTGPRIISHIADEIIDAIIEAGGVPVGIASKRGSDFSGLSIWKNLLENDEFADIVIPQLRRCDGVVLPGGEISEPIEIAIARWAWNRDLPCLGICAGQNNMVRALGGTTKLVQNPEKHATLDRYAHEVFPVENSLFASIVGVDSMRVNSRHLRTLDFIPEELIVSALDDDGNPEVVEAPSKRFFMGVRFHPESLIDDDRHRAIFTAFVDACRS